MSITPNKISTRSKGVRYYWRHREKILLKKRLYCKKNSEKLKKLRKKCYDKNKDKISKKRRSNNCIDCGKPCWWTAIRCKDCYIKIAKEKTREKAYNWKGGIFKGFHGYIWCFIGKDNTHPNAHNGYIKEHHYVWITQNTWGMWFIPKGWVVHHINAIRDDNRMENLVCIPNSLHCTTHNKIRWRKQDGNIGRRN